MQFYGLGNLRAKTIILISFLHFRFDKAICTIVDQAKQPGFRIHKYATTSVSPIQASLGLCNSWEKKRKLVTVWKFLQKLREINLSI